MTKLWEWQSSGGLLLAVEMTDLHLRLHVSRPMEPKTPALFSMELALGLLSPWALSELGLISLPRKTGQPLKRPAGT